MKQRLIYGLVTLVLALNLLVGARVYLASAEGSEKDSPYPNLELFSYVMERVRKDYVDGDTLTYKELVYGALKGMLNGLDPHSEFMEPYKLKDLQDDTQGAFGGLGIVISMRDDSITVVSPMDESPGFKAGILSGDRIVEIDGDPTEQMNVDEAKKMLRGDPGTQVSLTIFPALFERDEGIQTDTSGDQGGYGQRHQRKTRVSVGREQDRVCKAGSIWRTGQRRVDRRTQETEEAGDEWPDPGLAMEPWRLLEEAVEVCEKFLPRGQLVVSTEGRGSGQNQQRRAQGKGDILEGVPIVVMVNLGSASASEIVAGCLQDLGRATVLGEKTFGKGSVQSIVQLPDGSALRLTTAKYYTPSHKVIHEQGITPDIVVPLTDDEERSVLIQRAPGGLEGLDPETRQQILQSRDPQFQRAVDLLNGVKLMSERLDTDDKRLAQRSKASPRPVSYFHQLPY